MAGFEDRFIDLSVDDEDAWDALLADARKKASALDAADVETHGPGAGEWDSWEDAVENTLGDLIGQLKALLNDYIYPSHDVMYDLENARE